MMAGVPFAVSLRPGAFAADVGAELSRLFRAPRAELGVIAFNAVIVAVGWFVLPAGLKDWLFDKVPGPIAFAIVLETWLLSDVTSTNVFGHDVDAALAALHRPGGVRGLLRVKVTALALLIGAPCAVVAVAIAAHLGSVTAGLVFVPILLALPFSVVLISAAVGIVLPYKIRSLRWRWTQRRSWRTTARWLAAVLIPYWLVGLLATALIVPAFVVASRVTAPRVAGAPPTATIALAGLFSCIVAAVAAAVVPWLWEWLAMSVRAPLAEYLSDPRAG